MITTYPFLKPNWLLLDCRNSVNFSFKQYSNNFEIMGLMAIPHTLKFSHVKALVIQSFGFGTGTMYHVAVTKSGWNLLAS